MKVEEFIYRNKELKKKRKKGYCVICGDNILGRWLNSLYCQRCRKIVYLIQNRFTTEIWNLRKTIKVLLGVLGLRYCKYLNLDSRNFLKCQKFTKKRVWSKVRYRYWNCLNLIAHNKCPKKRKLFPRGIKKITRKTLTKYYYDSVVWHGPDMLDKEDLLLVTKTLKLGQVE